MLCCDHSTIFSLTDHKTERVTRGLAGELYLAHARISKHHNSSHGICKYAYGSHLNPKKMKYQTFVSKITLYVFNIKIEADLLFFVCIDASQLTFHNL